MSTRKPKGNQELHRLIGGVLKDTVKLRREIHMHPELSGEEFATARRVYAALRNAGLRPKYCLKKRGVVAILKNGAGPTVLLRADIDALPIEEQNNVSFKSKRRGVMHACGHDMHTAALVGAAKVLVQLKDRVRGSVVFVFQPNEEAEPGGALPMLKEGAIPSNVDAAFALHVTSDLRCGRIGMNSGETCATILTFDVNVRGRGGHGAKPEKAVDPIVCSASMIMELQTLISRECSPLDAAVLTVGTIHAGTKRNVIPDEAEFRGTIRTFSGSLLKKLRTRVSGVIRGVARSYGTRVRLGFEQSYPAVWNDAKLVERLTVALTEATGSKSTVCRTRPSMGGDDFAYFSKRSKSVYAYLGVRPEGETSVTDIHSAHFLPDENALHNAILFHVVAALDTAAL